MSTKTIQLSPYVTAFMGACNIEMIERTLHTLSGLKSLDISNNV